MVQIVKRLKHLAVSLDFRYLPVPTFMRVKPLPSTYWMSHTAPLGRFCPFCPFTPPMKQRSPSTS